jgi:lipoprotein Spr
MQKLISPFQRIFLLILIVGLNACSPKKQLGSTENPYKEFKVSEVDFKNKKLQRFVSDWFGTPYQFGGSSKKGVDCSGFINQLYAQVYNIQVPRNTAALSNESRKINPSKLKEGDLVFFNISGKKVSHVGVYIQNDKFVHASTKVGVTISSLQNPYYKKHFAKAARIKT